MTDRNRILAELADRSRRDLQLRYDHFDREEAARTAAISDERKKQLNLTPEHFRKAWEFIEGRRVHERDQLEKGIAFFGTFSSDVLAALDDDLRNEGPFSKAHGISLLDGTPGRHSSRHSGTASFLSEFESRHSGERYIRDFFTFLPTDAAIIHDAWAALGLEEPVGLTEVADRQYSRQAISNLLLTARALRSTQDAYYSRLVTSTGYSWGDEFAYRTHHLRHLTRAFAKHLLDCSPSDEELAQELGDVTDDRYGLTLEGVTEQDFLEMLGRYRNAPGARP
ncbi:hypothetical protein [Arthrobacter sp. OY3WO11]|uniref:hypothetical protein n=1 Tax=Arthrobacter sp. OY3WO11 TaxID=1835723 RepID=UPI0007CF1D21|nr:hypothetical protein [Arthrobacter sp. OY3WO11]OAE02513.1 hypothetical protein A6A22_14570 [Arthrobacter sp. OY3WO11]